MYQYDATSVGPGWANIVQPLIDYCKANDIQIMQIKEKFGGLRFYVGEASDDFYELLKQAEAAAEVTCETCGKPGRVRNSGWLKTLCDDHAKPIEEANNALREARS